MQSQNAHHFVRMFVRPLLPLAEFVGLHLNQGVEALAFGHVDQIDVIVSAHWPLL